MEQLELNHGIKENSLKSDKRQTLDETKIDTLQPNSQDISDRKRKSGKLKRAMKKTKAAGLVVCAMAVIMIANTLSGAGLGKCLYCEKQNCECWPYIVKDMGWIGVDTSDIVMDEKLLEELEELHKYYEHMLKYMEEYGDNNVGNNIGNDVGNNAGDNVTDNGSSDDSYVDDSYSDDKEGSDDQNITSSDRVLPNGLMDISDVHYYSRGENGYIFLVDNTLEIVDYRGMNVAYPRGYVANGPGLMGTYIVAEFSKEEEGSYTAYSIKGNQVALYSGGISAGIGEEDIFYIMGSQYGYDEELGTDTHYIEVTYYNPDGSQVYYDKWELGEQYNSMGTAAAFRDGVAYYTRVADVNGNTMLLYEVDLAGDAKQITSFEGDIAGAPMDGYVVLQEFTNYKNYLYNIKTGESGTPISEVLVSLLYEDGGVSNGVEATTTQKVYSSDFDIYGDAGANFMHYQTYGVVDVGYGTTNKQLLIDYYDSVEDGMITSAIAVYDEIYLDNCEYLLAREGEDWFYIDLEGNVVSETFDYATSFNDTGHAMVVIDGKASIINTSFLIMYTIPDATITEVAENGDVFWLLDADGKEYLYYYE